MRDFESSSLSLGTNLVDLLSILLHSFPMKHSNNKIIQIVKSATSWADVCRSLGIKPATGAQTYIKSLCIKFKIDFSHFKGQGWNKGGKALNAKPTEYYLALDGPFIISDNLKKRLIREGVKSPSCETCFGSEWMGKKMPLELDHINGVHSDNRLENLRILCPNCHAQTETYCSKNIK